MAHLALLIDDDPARRSRFMQRVRSLFADLPGASSAEATVGPLACVWAHGPRAPVSRHGSGEAFALLLGYGIDDDDRWITAADLPARWLRDRPERGIFDGYHVGVAFDAAAGLAVAVDPLGLFPLYHGTTGDAVVVATTPEAFACHDAFTQRIDRESLAGILLVGGPLDDRPLLAGVRRLGRGHRLAWSRDRGLESRPVQRMVGQAPPPGESDADALRRIDAELTRAIRRHRPPHAPAALMLSGGIDSRVVAGWLADLGAATDGVTFGEPDDFEVRAATAVAERLGMPHTVVSTDSCADTFPDVVRRAVRFCHLNDAPAADDFAAGLALAGTAAPFFWSGIALDWTLEPVWEANGGIPGKPPWSFDKLLELMNRWGVARGDLPALLGSDGVDLVAAVTARLQAACLAGPEEPFIASNMVRWDQRMRNHIATALHQTTFVSWPLMPATDRRLFAAVFGLPVRLSGQRRLEEAMLLARRPDLARIARDTNSFRFDSIRHPGTRQPLLVTLLSAGRKRLRRLYWQRIRGFDPRRYERLYNVDHPRWLAVRRAAEPLRARLHGLLDPAALARALPAPDVRLRHGNPVNHGSPIRLLLGLALWTDRPDMRRGGVTPPAWAARRP